MSKKNKNHGSTVASEHTFSESKVKSIRDTNERAIAEFILTAISYGIIHDRTEANDGIYYTFELESTGERYEIYFGEKPSRESIIRHPKAERAIKASTFIQTLLNEMNVRYNCFIVTSDRIAAPSEASVKSAVGINGFEIEHDEYKTSDSKSDTAAITHELEVEIFASIGKEYRRMIDTVQIHTKASERGKTEIYFEHSGGKRRFLNDTEAERIGRSIGEREKNDAKNLFSAIMGNDDLRDDSETQLRKKAIKSGEMLTALAKSEKSSFHRFLVDAARHEDTPVGDISIIPCTFFVGAAKDKCFVYNVKTGGRTLEFAITWNKGADDLNDDVPLYIYTDKNGIFRGFTYERTVVEDGVVRVLEKFDKTRDKLTVAYGVGEKKNIYPVALTLLCNAPKVGMEKYKGVSNYAIAPTDVSFEFKKSADGKAFMKNEIQYIDGGWYLCKDISICGYRGDKHWMGNLSRACYLTDNLTIKENGLILTQLTTSAYKKNCPSCNTSFYAEKVRYDSYSAKYALLDGTHGCENCFSENKIITGANNVRAKLVSAVRSEDTSAVRRKGYVFAKLEGSGGNTLKPIAAGGNVYECGGSCGELVYTSTKTDAKCPVCKRSLCARCKNAAEKNNRIIGVDGEALSANHYCPSCGREDRTFELVRRLIPDVKLANRTERGVVLANPNFSTKTYRCGGCENVVFDEAQSYEHCDCCDAPMEKNCFDQRAPMYGMKLCAECTRYAKNEGSAKLVELFTELSGIKKDILEFAKFNEQLSVGFDKTFGKKILPYLNFADRLTALRNLKAGQKAYLVDIRSTSPRGGKRKKGAAYVKVDVTGGSSISYYFIIDNKKIRLEDAW